LIECVIFYDYVDPRFGISVFSMDRRSKVKYLIKYLVQSVETVRSQEVETLSSSTSATEESFMSSKYIFYGEVHIFPSLAVLAKKYLSVQASAAACERMFNFSGHIFSCKRRRLNIRNFINLVFLKLNENFL